jgi:hypothetical protein
MSPGLPRNTATIEEANSYELTPDQEMAILHKRNILSGKDMTGHAPERYPTKQELLQIHKRNLGMLERTNQTKRKRHLVLPFAYSPCTVSVQELEKVCQPPTEKIEISNDNS